MHHVFTIVFSVALGALVSEVGMRLGVPIGPQLVIGSLVTIGFIISANGEHAKRIAKKNRPKL